MTRTFVNNKTKVVTTCKKSKRIRVVAKAKCHDLDAFNEKVGKKLATIRAEKKFATAQKVYFTKRAEKYSNNAKAYAQYAENAHEPYEKAVRDLKEFLFMLNH